jgi:predicted transcriptional regulator
MSPVKETVSPDESIIKAIYIMMERHLQLLPVIEQGTIKGVIRLNEIFNEIANRVMGD